MIDRLKQGDKVPFTQISNKMLNDPELPCKAKGLLAYMLSKPDGWNFNVKGMASQLKENKDTISSILTILRAHRYVERRELRDKGAFKGYEYVVYQAPCPKTSDTASSDPVFSDISNKEISNNDLSNKRKDPESAPPPEDNAHDARNIPALPTNQRMSTHTEGPQKIGDILARFRAMAEAGT